MVYFLMSVLLYLVAYKALQPRKQDAPVYVSKQREADYVSRSSTNKVPTSAFSSLDP